MAIKLELAQSITKRLCGQVEADTAREHFRGRYQCQSVTLYAPVLMSDYGLSLGQTLSIVDLVVRTSKFSFSKSHVRRLISQNAVKWNEQAIKNPMLAVQMQDKATLSVGKHQHFLFEHRHGQSG